MLDFMMVSEKRVRGVTEIYPKFIIPTTKKSSDLMIRGGDFYAVWIEELGLWSTDEGDALQLIDNELKTYYNEHKGTYDTRVKVLYMWDAENKMIDSWIRYCKKQLRDSYHMLDEKVVFSNTAITKKDYASKRLPYALQKGSHNAYDELMDVLYSPEERRKLEWAIGSIISGDSRKIQKFIVLYGSSGTGKSTILNIIQQLFEGYYSTFDARALGSSSNSFALEAFKSNPLVAIQHDGDLSRIEDNTRLNSLVSHELMTVNEKFKSTYTNRFKSFLFMGTNKPVKITDAKSGLIRRLIDVSPTGNLVSQSDYKTLMQQITFELGAIAYHCMEVYQSDPDIYDNYIPTKMIGASNDFYNYVLDSYYKFKDNDSVSLTVAYEWYKAYCDEANITYTLNRRIFAEELKNYFEEFYERKILDDGTRVRSYYVGFKTDLFKKNVRQKEHPELYFVNLTCRKSVFDEECADFPAQYAKADGTPTKKWSEVTTKLSDLDTSKVHYVKLPKNHIVIDFDLRDENGEKSQERNVMEASKWPQTYAELSKSEAGVHLHYIYLGDVSQLNPIYAENIEIKVFKGNSALRRKLTKCNNLPIATISSGLPLKEEKGVTMVNAEQVQSENGLRRLIKRNLNKEIMPSTKSSIDFIKKILDDAYESDLKYDVSDMRNAIMAFATNSSHQALYCIKLVDQMKFASEEPAENVQNESTDIIFYDVEVFPNLFLVNWKTLGDDKVIRMINPTSEQIEELIRYRLVGFNCRRYDNHILYGRLVGYSNEQLYSLSQSIINAKPNCFFREAYNISYTDIYDYAAKKQSLKKWEIELGFHHQELGLRWDQPVPENLWQKVAEYCDNDVLATEAVWKATQADFTAREILADLAGGSVNDTTNQLTTKIIFGNDKHPQDSFNYRFMGDESKVKIIKGDYELFDELNRPIFPGYIFDHGKSTYRGELVGEGGYVYSEPGIYFNVALLDIASMHPHSIIAELLFGKYTKIFEELVQARIEIKHKDFKKAGALLGGKLAPYLKDESKAKDLAQALKIAINSVYGLTAAKFENAFRDVRNIDNIVAKRGALFMINLKHQVQERGFTVAHIKTDSIKIPNATPEIISFVMEYGKLFGYTFEHEATYERMCLIDKADYIARYPDGHWEATGAIFQEPYVFKTLFSHEDIEFDDLCRTNAVSGDSALYLDMNENLPEGEHNYVFIGKIGRFVPVREGCGGGILYRFKDGKYYAASGTKGYRWIEAEVFKELMPDKEHYINYEYWEKMALDAGAHIVAYGCIDAFCKGEPMEEVEFMNKPE